MSRAEAPFIAADVGGTHVRIGLVRASGDPAHPVAVLKYRKYVCAQYPGLAEIIEDFVSGLDGVAVSEGAIASAGYPLEDGSLITVNLPWRVSLEEIRTRLGFRAFRLVNDFEAVAHAAAYVDASEVLQLTGPDTAPIGPTLVVGPGTGLGAAVWIPTAHGPVVLATEAGQAALTTGTELEMALLKQMLGQRVAGGGDDALARAGRVGAEVGKDRAESGVVGAAVPAIGEHVDGRARALPGTDQSHTHMGTADVGGDQRRGRRGDGQVMSWTEAGDHAISLDVCRSRGSCGIRSVGVT
jgi:glucokinase